MDARARVFNHHDPYDLKGTEDAFVAAMRENALFQQAGCADYARILREQDFDPASIQSMRDLERLPCTAPTPCAGGTANTSLIWTA